MALFQEYCEDIILATKFNMNAYDSIKERVYLHNAHFIHYTSSNVQISCFSLKSKKPENMYLKGNKRLIA